MRCRHAPNLTNRCTMLQIGRKEHRVGFPFERAFCLAQDGRMWTLNMIFTQTAGEIPHCECGGPVGQVYAAPNVISDPLATFTHRCGRIKGQWTQNLYTVSTIP